MEIRRVVTGVDADGRSKVVSDGPPTRAHDFVHMPGYTNAMVWATEEPPAVPTDGSDPTGAVKTQFPTPGGTRLIMIELPPSGRHTPDDADPGALLAEMEEHTPGLAGYLEEGSFFHATPSVDYHVMLSGELWLILDEGEVRVGPGDVVIQNGTRHHWENRTGEPARFVTIPVGANWAP
jgi:mannose-6-phosphate isomerase-like protein (cupin superfamily)